MAQRWIDVGDYVVNVSTHGYFIVFSKKVPGAKFSSAPGTLYHGFIDELSYGDVAFTYDVEEDEIVMHERGVEVARYVDVLKAEELVKAVERWVKEHEVMLRKLDEEAEKAYEEAKKHIALRLPKGELRIGDKVKFHGREGEIVWIDHAKGEVLVKEGHIIWGTSFKSAEEKLEKL